MSAELFLNAFECLGYFLPENGSELNRVFKQAVQRHIETICIKKRLTMKGTANKYKNTNHLKTKQMEHTFYHHYYTIRRNLNETSCYYPCPWFN